MKTRSGNGWIAAVLFVIAGAGIATNFIAVQAAKDQVESVSLGHAKALSHAFRNAANEVLPSVVSIRTAPVVVNADEPGEGRRPRGFGQSPFDQFFNDPNFRRFFDEAPRRRGGGAGSGVIIDAEGVILTNNHVVAGGGKITVRLADGREFPGVELAADEKTDLAIVRIKGAENLKAVQLGDSDRLDIGDWVLALGQPFGLQGTVTAGIISAKGRGLGIADREDFLQTDAAVNPGNSGGPLVNLDGEVVGINTAISSSTGGYQGVAFAVPVNLARWVATQLVKDGAVRRAQLGVQIMLINQKLADEHGVKPHEGVLVEQIGADSPADKAGLKVDDVILSFAGTEIRSPRELQNAVERSRIGEPEKMAIIRDGKKLTLDVTLREAREDLALEFGQEGWQEEALGFGVRNLTGPIARQLDVEENSGVLVTNVKRESIADKAGLEAGMIVTRVNRKDVKNVKQFHDEVQKAGEKEGTLLNVKTEDGSRIIVLQREKK